MLLFFIRHGDPTYDPNELTPLGRRQAEALARRLARYGLDEIYMSSSTRAMETAKPTCELLKKEATVLDWTNEDHAWAKQAVETQDGGRTWAFFLPEYKNLFTSREVRDLGDRWYNHPKLKGSSIAEGHLELQAKTREFLKSLGYLWDEERGQYKNLHLGKNRVALFAHHGFGTNFLSAVLNIPYPQICLKTNYGHTGMTVIDFGGDDYVIPQMLTMANDGHLLADNMPACYNNYIYF